MPCIHGAKKNYQGLFGKEGSGTPVFKILVRALNINGSNILLNGSFTEGKFALRK